MEVNKRAGREEELRRKVKETIDRYESVFNVPLSTEALESFLNYSEENNRNVFLTGRIGVLSDMDVKYLRNVLKENTKGTNRAINDPLPDPEALEGLDDIEDGSNESDDIADFSA